MNDKLWDVVVVGGGAAGLMAAGTAARHGKKVLILEKNKKVGAKLGITGGGRCNVTNNILDTRVFLKNYGKAEPFLYSMFSIFGVRETFSFFESRGLPLVTQARNRVFPKTESAQDVVSVMEKYCTHENITLKTGVSVTDVICGDHGIDVLHTTAGTYTAKKYIFATGGVSHPETGSTGDGFVWLKKIGHTIEQPTPSIVPLAVQEAWVKKLAGTSLSFMKITFFVDGKKAFSKTGKVLFTHFGLSGPLILNSATQVGDLLYVGQVTAAIDMYPDTEFDALERAILAVFDKNKNKIFKNVIKECVPEGMSDAVLDILGSAVGDIKVHSFSKEMRKKLIHVLKSAPVTISGLMGFDRAVVADGGVPLEEIDTRTLQSKKASNVYIVGDLLHINRPSGGFSLQLCWTTGYVAGENV